MMHRSLRALVAAGLLVALGACGSGGDPRVSRESPGLQAGALPDDWRTERFGGVAVDVPAAWGWGTTPTRLAGEPGWCGGPGAVVLPGGGGSTESGADPWVGRPVTLSDMCVLDEYVDGPRVEYVWMGADVDPGRVDLGDGWVQETETVDGTAVTVASPDGALRQAVLDSARPDRLCPAILPAVPRADSALTVEGRGALLDARACAYRRDEGAAQLALVWGTELAPREVASAYAAEEAAGGPVPDEGVPCGEELVLLEATYDDSFGDEDLHRRAVLDVGCGVVEILRDERAPLVEGGVAPWAEGRGTRAILVGPRYWAPWASRYFVGMQG